MEAFSQYATDVSKLTVPGETVNRYIHGGAGTAAEFFLLPTSPSIAPKNGEFSGMDACLQCVCLVFSKVPEDSLLTKHLANSISMGSLSESYSVLMNFVPRSYRVQCIPQDAYDAMIFVANAILIEIESLNKQFIIQGELFETFYSITGVCGLTGRSGKFIHTPFLPKD